MNCRVVEHPEARFDVVDNAVDFRGRPFSESLNREKLPDALQKISERVRIGSGAKAYHNISVERYCDGMIGVVYQLFGIRASHVAASVHTQIRQIARPR